MLSATLIVRCTIFALLALILPIIHTQVCRWKDKEDFHAWQLGFFGALGAILLNYFIAVTIRFPNIAICFVGIDIIFCYVVGVIIQQQALTTLIAQQQIQFSLRSYLTNKVAFLTTISLGAAVSKISSCTSATNIEKMDELLRLYELFEIPLSNYINHIVLQNFNQIYSISSLTALLLSSLLAYAGLRWYIKEFFNMELKYQYIFTVFTFLVVCTYNLLLFSAINISFVCGISCCYIIAFIIWWWFVDSEFTPQRELHKHNAQKI